MVSSVLVCMMIFGITPLDVIWVYWPGDSVGAQASELKLKRETDDTCFWAEGLLGTLGWSDGSFSLPQDDIDESADKRQREGNPCQDVGVAEDICIRHPIRTHHRVDDGPTHHEQTCRGEKVSTEKGCSTIRSCIFAVLHCLVSWAEWLLTVEASRSVFPRWDPSTLHHNVPCLLNSSPAFATPSCSAHRPDLTWHDLFVRP